MEQPLVSVCTATYNQVEFIRDALMSALEQDYPNLQVVAGDDGSTDGTAEILLELSRKYPDRLTPIIGEPHLGITRNCNRALRACRGKYIALFAGDDLFLPGKISAQVNWLESDERRILCGHDVEIFDSATNTCLGLWSHRFPLESGRGAGAVVRNGYVFPGISIMARRSAFPVHGYDERLPVMSDWKLWIDCLAGGGVYGYIDGVYTRYRRHSGSVSSNRCQALFDDETLTLALVESTYPRYMSACRYHRARTFQSKGMWHLRSGETHSARSYFANAVYQHPVAAWKSSFGILLTLLSSRMLHSLLPLVESANKAVAGAERWQTRSI